MSYLLDTNVITELVKSSPNKKVLAWFAKIPSECLYLSVLTLGEIRKGVEKLSNSEKKTRFRIWLEHELPAWFGDRIIPIDKAVSERWGRLQAELPRLPAIDSLLAATALHHDLALVTRSTKDFVYPGLMVVNPW